MLEYIFWTAFSVLTLLFCYKNLARFDIHVIPNVLYYILANYLVFTYAATFFGIPDPDKIFLQVLAIIKTLFNSVYPFYLYTMCFAAIIKEIKNLHGRPNFKNILELQTVYFFCTIFSQEIKTAFFVVFFEILFFFLIIHYRLRYIGSRKNTFFIGFYISVFYIFFYDSNYEDAVIYLCENTLTVIIFILYTGPCIVFFLTTIEKITMTFNSTDRLFYISKAKSFNLSIMKFGLFSKQNLFGISQMYAMAFAYWALTYLIFRKINILIQIIILLGFSAPTTFIVSAGSERFDFAKYNLNFCPVFLSFFSIWMFWVK